MINKLILFIVLVFISGHILLYENKDNLFAKEAIASVPRCYQDTDPHWKKNPEKSAKKILKNVSPEEIAKRLIFSEAIATKCFNKKTVIDRDQERAIIEGIAWIIANRVNANSNYNFGSGYDGVALRKYQFRSSLGGCDVSERKIFLCPQSSPEFLMYWSTVEQVFITIENSSKSNPLDNVYNYYFNHHFNDSKNCSKWSLAKNRPKWANKKNRIKPNLNQINHDSGCVNF